jgi:flagellar basal body-associated protein FliL
MSNPTQPMGYPPQPAYPQPPQEPKKKRGALKVILIVVGIFVALIVLMGACVAAIGRRHSGTAAAQRGINGQRAQTGG